MAAKSKSVADLFFNGSGPGNQFTKNVHMKRPVIHFPLAFYCIFLTLTVIHSQLNTGRVILFLNTGRFRFSRDGWQP